MAQKEKCGKSQNDDKCISRCSALVEARLRPVVHSNCKVLEKHGAKFEAELEIDISKKCKLRPVCITTKGCRSKIRFEGTIDLTCDVKSSHKCNEQPRTLVQVDVLTKTSGDFKVKKVRDCDSSRSHHSARSEHSGNKNNNQHLAKESSVPAKVSQEARRK